MFPVPAAVRPWLEDARAAERICGAGDCWHCRARRIARRVVKGLRKLRDRDTLFKGRSGR